MPRSRPPYSPEFRRQMVDLVRAGRSPEDLAKEFEPTAQSIGAWMAVADKQDGRREEVVAGLGASERDELSRLRRENKQLRLERDILSKAAAWFARETGAVSSGLTAGLNALGNWAEKNPNIARVAVDAAGGLGLVATALGTLSTAIFLFGPALKLLGVGSSAPEAAGAVAVGLAKKVGIAGLALAGAPGAILGAALGGLFAASADPRNATVENERARLLAAGKEVAKQGVGFGTPTDGYNDNDLIHPRGSASNPVNVIVKNADEVGAHAASGVVSGVTRGLSRPPPGSTSHDSSMSPAYQSGP